MLVLLSFAAVLAQEPSAPPPPPETRSHVFVRTVGDGPGLDRDGDGQVTREEFARPLNDAFAEMDKDGDGRLSTAELAVRRPGDHGGPVVMMSGRPNGPGGSHRFEIRSRDGGTEVREDRQVIILGGHDGRTDIFGRLGEGRFDIQSFGEGDEGRADLDRDGDGKVTEAEFTAPLRDAFGRMDADQSGFLEEGERVGGDVRVFTHRIERRE